MPPPAPRTTLFPYTTLFRSQDDGPDRTSASLHRPRADQGGARRRSRDLRSEHRHRSRDVHRSLPDRKNTRLNSSHEWISYAVFCLKKKTYTVAYVAMNFGQP